jgi:hypothetical protein
VTEFEVAAADVPMALVAVTAKVYAVPGCRPSKVMVPPVACVSVLVIPPGDEVAVYEVIAEPLDWFKLPEKKEDELESQFNLL